MILGLPIDAFIGIFLLMTAFLVVGYFLLRQALIDSHFEIKRREDEERNRRGGKR